jgi:hypothetical protein
MLPSSVLTVSALADSIIRAQCGPGTAEPAAVVRFVQDQRARMPDYIRLPLAVLTLAFDAWAIPFTGKTFHRLPHERRWRQIQAWRHSSLSVRRDLIRFYESLIVFGWHAEVYARPDA